MPPPELARDAPVTDVLEPVQVDLLEAFRDDTDAPVPHHLDSGLGQWRHAYEPLQRNPRLDDGVAALAVSHRVMVRLGFHQIAGRVDGLQQLPAGLEAVQPGKRPRLGAHGGVVVHDVDERQPVARPDLIVRRVVRGSHLHSTGAEGRIHRLVSDNRDQPANDRQPHLHADHVLVALVIRVYSDRRIAENGLRSCGGDGDRARAVL